MTPLCLLGGPARTQFEIASVEQRLLINENKALRRTKDMSRRHQHHVYVANSSSLPKWQRMLDARARQADPHQTRCAFGKNDLRMRRDVVAVRVGNERETFWVPWVQPEILLRQVDTALVANFNHTEELLPNLHEFYSTPDRMSTAGCALTPASRSRFITGMRFAAALVILIFLAVSASGKGAREEPQVVEKVKPLPVALDSNFEFRKTKLFYLSEKGPKPSERSRQDTTKLGAKGHSADQKTATLSDAPIVFERQYRLFGAVTGLDQRQRFGDYFDFFLASQTPVRCHRASGISPGVIARTHSGPGDHI
jgi:hypothetical protein